MKNYLIVLCCVVSGCCFSRYLKVNAKGADAQIYGSLDNAVVENYWCISLMKECK